MHGFSRFSQPCRTHLDTNCSYNFVADVVDACPTNCECYSYHDFLESLLQESLVAPSSLPPHLRVLGLGVSGIRQRGCVRCVSLEDKRGVGEAVGLDWPLRG